jgi:hypothetical protein
MTEERRPRADLLAKAGDGDFLRSVAEAVLQMLMAEGGPWPEPEPGPTTSPVPEPGPAPGPVPGPTTSTRTLRVTGAVPPEVWNRLGTKILPKLRSGSELRIRLEFSVSVSADSAPALANELRQILQELGLADAVKVQ